MSNLKFVHPSLKELFPHHLPTAPKTNAGKIQYFVENWKILSGDPNIHEIVQSWKLPLVELPYQGREPIGHNMVEKEKVILDQEVKSMLKKEVMKEVAPQKDQFLATIFVRPKKEENKYRPIINLKQLNQHLPYLHFQMEGLKNVKNLLQEGDYLIKIDLKEAYWHIPIHPSSRKNTSDSNGDKNVTKCWC